MNKYYATITIKVLIQADNKDEAQDELEFLTDKTVEVLDVRDVDILDAGVKITDVK